MEKVVIDIKRIQARLFLDYGVNLDETSIVILSILRHEAQKQFSTQNEKMGRTIERLCSATEAINHSQRSLQVDTNHPRWQAFWFGVGKWGFPMIFFILLLFITGLIYSSGHEDNKTLKTEWGWYKAYYDSMQASKNKEPRRLQNNHSKIKI